MDHGIEMYDNPTMTDEIEKAKKTSGSCEILKATSLQRLTEHYRVITKHIQLKLDQFC